MGRILDARGEEALDVLAELLEPVGEIAKDKPLMAKMRSDGGGTMFDFTRVLLKDHKEAVIKMLAIDDGKTVDEERGLITTLMIPVRLFRLFSVPAVRDLLFGSAETGTPATGSAAESSSGNG